jgi:DNA-binding protein HU-beta
MKTNKENLVASIASLTGFTKKDSKIALEAVISSIQTALANGEKVTLSGFGTFKVRATNARTARNPRTGEPVAVPAGVKPVFTFSKSVKEEVNA